MAHFLPSVAVAQFDKVLLMVRDIANPSSSDAFFPLWRHKDWFVGSSWASGIVKREWGPDPHGRNQVVNEEAEVKTITENNFGGINLDGH